MSNTAEVTDRPAHRIEPPEYLLQTLSTFRSMIDNMPDLVFIKDANSVYWACNPAFEAYAGRSEMAQIGHTDFDFFDRQSAEIFRERDRQVITDNAPHRHEESITYPDGRHALVDTLKSPIKGPEGQVIGLIGISRDITAERERDRSYRLLVETSHDGFWKVGPNTRLLEVNDTYCQLSGYSREELLTMSVSDLEADDRPDEIRRRMEQLTHNGSTLFETRHRRKDRSLWAVEISASYSESDRGVFYVFARDINQRKRDEQLEKVRLQLGELAVGNTIDELLQFALDSAELMTGSTIGFFHFVDTDEQTLTLQTWSTNTLKHMCKAEGKGQHYPISEAGVWADSVRERQAVLINDYARHTNKKGMPEGHALVSRVANIPLFDNDGKIIAVIGVGNKTTPYRDDDALLLTHFGNMAMEMVNRRRDADRIKLISSVFDTTQDGIVITDAKLNIIAANRAFTRISGYTPAEVFGRDPRTLDKGYPRETFYQDIAKIMATRGYWQGEVIGRNKSDKEFTLWLTLNMIRDATRRITNYLAVFSDMSEKKAADARADYLARMDALTGLPNRSDFETTLDLAAARARRREKPLGLLLVGLDRFKGVNESFGHPVGDEVLKMAAERLQERLRHEDLLGRLGGDEFAVIVEEVERTENLAYLAQLIIDALAKPFRVRDVDVYVGASVGISVLPTDATDSAGLLRNVDSALALAKAQGRGVYRFYTESMTSQARERMSLQTQLREGLSKREFEVFYQPQLDLRNGRVSGVEALVRWRRSDGTLISPASFIPIAEATGLIIDLGAWVLGQACADVKAWLDAGTASLTVAVNVSARQFHPKKLPETVREALQMSGLPPHLLELEITESVVMGQAEEAVALLNVLKGLGVTLAIDDFGTGYSSLSYLKRFPMDKLKIDQSFVRDIPHSSDDMEIAATIISMGRQMRMKVLAEGVETIAQREFLKSNGCDEMQGYLFSRPVPAAECLQKIRQNILPAGLAN